VPCPIFLIRAFSYIRLVPCPIFLIRAFSYRRLVPCPIFLILLIQKFFNSGLLIQKTGALSNFFNSGLFIQKTGALYCTGQPMGLARIVYIYKLDSTVRFEDSRSEIRAQRKPAADTNQLYLLHAHRTNIWRCPCQKQLVLQK